MNYINICLLLSVFAFYANGGQTDWTELSVTYNADINAKWSFDRMPFNREEAEAGGWKQIGGKKAGCGGVGYRYMLNNDPAAVPIYAESGIIVGLENGVPESVLKSDKLIAWYKQQPMFQVEHPENNKSETIYTSRVYLTDPDKICNENFEYVHNFFLMNGTKKVSLAIDESKLGSDWVKGKCTPAKGMHYFYKLVKDFDCNNFLPFFPLYTGGKLVAFSFVSFGEFQLTSNRYGPSEYHPSDTYTDFADNIPDCMYKFGNNLTSLHGYMIANPWRIKC